MSEKPLNGNRTSHEGEPDSAACGVRDAPATLPYDRWKRWPLRPLHGFLHRLRTYRCTERNDRERLGYPEIELRDALHHPGCPVCTVEAQTDDRYLSGFLHESYQEPEVIAQLIASFGFCPVHSAMLFDRMGATSQIAFVHQILTQRLYDTLAGPRSRFRFSRMLSNLQRPAPCPACRFGDESAARSARFLVRLLDHEDDRRLYARSDLLCCPHLNLLASLGSEELFRWILPIHRAAVQDAFDEPDPSRFIQRTLQVAAGDGFSPFATPRLGPDVETGPADFAQRVIEALPRDDRCAVCCEEQRALNEWYAWLDSAADRRNAIADVLPTCPVHLRAGVRRGGKNLVRALTGHAMTAVRTQLDFAAKALDRSQALRFGSLQSVVAVFGSRRGSFAKARATLARSSLCPVCRRIETARERTLLLLFALLEESRHRSAFERGYGLCIRHFKAVPGLRPAEPALDAIIAVECAKLPRLAWDLEEYLRKTSWSQRPEAKGDELTASRKALERFSGTSWRRR
jgi:hypothetical protein